MAVENIEKFKEALCSDEALNKKFNETMAGVTPEDYAEQFSQFASGEGYAFTPEEFRENQMQGQELSDDDLEAVSGGADRDWPVDGCQSTVQAGDWCGSNDYCIIWSVTYDRPPLATPRCPHCKSYMYDGDHGYYICNTCGTQVKKLDK